MGFLMLSEKPLMYPYLIASMSWHRPCGPSFHRNIVSHDGATSVFSLLLRAWSPTQHTEKDRLTGNTQTTIVVVE